MQLSGSLDLAQDVLGQGLDGHAAAGGLGGEVLCVHLVESGKIAHVRQEAGGLDDLVKAAAGSLEDGANVLAALLSLSSDALADGAVSGVHRDLTGGNDQVADHKTLRVGADCAGSFFRVDNFHDASPFFFFLIVWELSAADNAAATCYPL